MGFRLGTLLLYALSACAVGLMTLAPVARAGIPGMDDDGTAAQQAPQETPQQETPQQETAPSPPQGGEPAAEQPALPPPPAEPEAEPVARAHHGRVEEIPWPGSFVAVRGALSVGQALVPQYDLDSNQQGVDSVGQIAPYLGTELFYSGKHWGGGVTFDASFFSLTPSSAWSGSPIHLLIGLEISYILNRSWRLDFGFNPYDYYHYNLPSGDSFAPRGVGLRVGAHLRLSEPTPSGVWELFAYAAIDRFVDAIVSTPSTTETHNIFDYTGVDAYSGTQLVVLGVQWNFRY